MKWPYVQDAAAGTLTGKAKLHHQSQRFPKFLALRETRYYLILAAAENRAAKRR